MQPVTVLTIAGSDSGGGAGIQADLRTFAAFAVHGTTAVTAVTAQNTLGVDAVHEIPGDAVRAQIDSVCADFDVRAVKTGMLASPQLVARVADAVRDQGLPSLVVDPVLVSTSGHALMDPGGVAAYLEELFPLAAVVTPNVREAALLCGVEVHDVRSVEDMAALARQLHATGTQWVLVKGGHAPEGPARAHAPDLLLGPKGLVVLDAQRVDTKNDHGTGCSLSAALAAGLALGRPVEDATRDAKSFVLAALEGARNWRLGAGHGPIDHLGWEE